CIRGQSVHAAGDCGESAPAEHAVGTSGADRSAGGFEGTRSRDGTACAGWWRFGKRRSETESPMGIGEIAMKKLLVMTTLAALASFPLRAQEKVTVPFRDPSMPRHLVVDAMLGAIQVTGYNGQEVIVESTESANGP